MMMRGKSPGAVAARNGKEMGAVFRARHTFIKNDVGTEG
jgi:hypothetical protein